MEPTIGSRNPSRVIFRRRTGPDDRSLLWQKEPHIVRDLEAKILVYSSKRKTQPQLPVYQYNCKSVEATSDKSAAVTINGRSFDLPIKYLHEALREDKADRRLGALSYDPEYRSYR